MKFTQITNECYGAKNAGYIMDRNAKIEYDPEGKERFIYDRGMNAFDMIPDSIFDFDGDAYLGDDGEVYTVYMAWDNMGMYPVAWMRLVKA